MRKLLLLSVVVMLAHAFLLWAFPKHTALFSGRQEGLMTQAQASSFVTRTIAPPAPEVPHGQAAALVVAEPPTRASTPSPAATTVRAEAPVKVQAPATGQAPAPARKQTAKPPTSGQSLAATPLAPATAAAPEPVPAAPATASLQMAATPGAASLQIAAATPMDASTKSRPEPVTETKAPAAASVGSNAARLSKPVYPPPTRLLYEGKGEEKGFLKYTAGGELVWAPEGTQYNAKLEITFLMARLRTWTSKGELGDTGLQPTRFGDKPRGAEQATHFQRDKGIISFSANNPDVPLQPGAQDKLSAILQLSAVVAGAPARYGAGSVISFQAADAHRAELWDFKVSGAESLELPGGTLSGLKLTKEPTVEFDQRIEVWLAPDLNYLPVRLRITEANGAFVDLLWRKTLKPE